MTARNYSDDMKRGFVIGSAHTLPNNPYANWCWHYGIDRGYPLVFGALDSSVAVYPTRREAEEVQFMLTNVSVRGYHIHTLAEARRKAEQQRQRAQAWRGALEEKAESGPEIVPR